MSGFAFRDSSSANAPDFLSMAVNLGAACYLRKPFGPAQLRTALKTCLGEATDHLAAGAAHPADGAGQAA